MTDIVFLLLIFFMVTFTSSVHSRLRIELPKSRSADAIARTVDVSIASDLRCRVNGTEVVYTQLPKVLADELKRAASKSVLLRVDKSVPVEHLVRVADVANSLEANVSIATDPIVVPSAHACAGP